MQNVREEKLNKILAAKFIVKHVKQYLNYKKSKLKNLTKI